MSFIQNIKSIRKLHKLTQAELAEKIGVHRQTILSWEKGDTQPDKDELDKMSKVFNISVDDLINKKEGKFDIKKPQVIMKKDNNGKEEAIRAAYKTIEDGDTEYVLIPLKVLEKTQLVSIDELERKNGQIDFYHNLLGGLLGNLELAPKPAKSKKVKE